MAFEVMLESTSSKPNNLEKIKAMAYIAKSSGIRGMIEVRLLILNQKIRKYLLRHLNIYTDIRQSINKSTGVSAQLSAMLPMRITKFEKFAEG